MGSLWSRTQGRTGIETDSLQTTSSHVDQEPEMTAWDRVFFRCILGIPPLMILLIPNIALPCKNKNLNMTEVMNDFQNVIFQDLQHLLELLATKSNNNNCRKPQKSNPFPCLNGKEIPSVHRLTCSVLYISKQYNFDFNQEIIILSKRTEKTLRCSCDHQKGIQAYFLSVSM
ncbi:uncharacterized protein LOC122549378 isoform X2 [Chiloscyllium plagiosum]|uniref:uncharacterized protein LOC122549378 isoform X2 n=1 Tax=Chiloscyllium plagiosum TaxID=36176 RepID=UPI001CB7D3CF|nr:uncharacterized protein LOC122549378 isoform X2 [Chiloscyllium plagiosum]